jgi:hypothetical protein
MRYFGPQECFEPLTLEVKYSSFFGEGSEPGLQQANQTNGPMRRLDRLIRDIGVTATPPPERPARFDFGNPDRDSKVLLNCMQATVNLRQRDGFQ